MSRLPVSLHASLRSLRLSSPATSSASARRLPSRQPYSSSSDGASSSEPAAEIEASEAEGIDPKPFSAPFHLPHQYSRVQTPNIIPGKVPRTTFDGAIPKEGVFTPENAHLSSRPLDVRQREAYEIDLLKPGEQLAILRPKELQKWWEARAMGRLATNPETVEEVRQSQEDWKAERLAERRARVHGVNKDGEIVGQRIYLPNIVFRLIPNATHFIRPKQDRKANKHANQRNKPLAMEQYNPYIATFRVPASLNKIDIKGYLKAVYNLETTFVSTALMHKTRYQVGGRGEWKNGKSKDNYKRAVVGLTKPFYYPNDPLGMAPEARTAYEERLNAEFNVTDYRVAEVAMRRRQYDNVRNNIGLSERSAKIYPTKPDESLKRSKPAQLAEKDRVRQELTTAVLEERKVASGALQKASSSEGGLLDALSEVEEEDWRSRR